MPVYNYSGKSERTIYHRFTCGKCGKTTGWIPTVINFKTSVETRTKSAAYMQEQLRLALVRKWNNYCDTIRKGAKKGYYFTPPPFTDAEYAYNLDSTCPYCKHGNKNKGLGRRSVTWGGLTGVFVGTITFLMLILSGSAYAWSDVIVPGIVYVVIVLAGCTLGFFIGKKIAGKRVEHTNVEYRLG